MATKSHASSLAGCNLEPSAGYADRLVGYRGQPEITAKDA